MNALSIAKGSDAVHRYGAYLGSHMHLLDTDELDRAEKLRADFRERLANWALTVATAPVMMPPYVSRHPRLRELTLGRNVLAERTYTRAVLSSPWPAELDHGTSMWRPLTHHGHPLYDRPQPADLDDVH